MLGGTLGTLSFTFLLLDFYPVRQEKLLAAKLPCVRMHKERCQKVYSFQAGQTGRVTEEKDSSTILVAAHVITMMLAQKR